MAVMPMSSDFDQEVTEFFRHYQDRGMQKWGGFYLSDHTAQIKKKRRQEQEYFPSQKTMSLQAVGQVLSQAFRQQLPVRLQLKQLDQDGYFQQDISGLVEGYDQEDIIISGQPVGLTAINHIEIIS